MVLTLAPLARAVLLHTYRIGLTAGMIGRKRALWLAGNRIPRAPRVAQRRLRHVMSFQIGDTVGTYRIINRLGSGGMGEVYQVEHAVTGRMEAMKVLAADASNTSEQDQRFLREIQLQAALDHPNIAAVHNAFRENGHLVMIMELIEGSSLRSLLERKPLPLAACIDYACQALAALDYAHAHGVVHRDISPANMIVTEDGTLKLTDFGLAKSQHNMRLTETGALLGSLYYTSPEQ